MAATGTRLPPLPVKIFPVKDWLQFLEERYKKNIRTIDDAQNYVGENKLLAKLSNVSPTNYFIYPDVTTNNRFNIFKYYKVYEVYGYNIIRVEYDNNHLYLLTDKGERITVSSNGGPNIDDTYDKKDLETYINSFDSYNKFKPEIEKSRSQGGGRRRRSRKAKKNKAHTPQ